LGHFLDFLSNFLPLAYDQLLNSYKDQVRGLLDGEVDILLVETVFDTLNCKVCIVVVHFV